MLFLGYFPLMSFVIFVLYSVLLISCELIINILSIGQLELLIDNLFLPAMPFFYVIFLTSIVINVFFFMKIWRMKHIKNHDKHGLLYLFFKLYIFTSCFCVDVFVERSRYTRFFVCLNMMRNILLGRIVEFVGNDVRHLFYVGLSPLESSIMSNILQFRRVIYLTLLIISTTSFFLIFVMNLHSGDTTDFLSAFVGFVVITAFLLGCYVYYTRFRK